MARSRRVKDGQRLVPETESPVPEERGDESEREGRDVSHEREAADTEREVPELGVPHEQRDTYAFGGNPGLSYTGNLSPAYHGERYYNDDAENPPERSYGEGSRSDEEIYREIYDRFAGDPDIDAEAVRIEVAQGRVTLRGSVDDRLTKVLMEDIIEGVSGVRDLQDEVELGGRPG